MSKILDLIYDEESIVVFDVDGVLAKYEFGERNHNSCSDEEWDANAEYESIMIYGAAKPVEVLQELIRNKKHSYACSMASAGEKDAKVSFIRRYYNIPEENIYLVKDKRDKLTVLCTIAEKHPEVPDEKIIIVEDTVKTLTYIQDNSNFSTCHISSFLE